MTEHECTIGIYDNYGDTNTITFEELKYLHMTDVKHYNENPLWTFKPHKFQDYFDERRVTNLIRFNYCPYCGKKIDQNELKRRCKDDK